MSLIYHIVTPQEWQEAQASGKRHPESLDTEGFIHCSSQDQVMRVANRFYSSAPAILLLVLDTDKISAPLKWEAPAHPDPSRPLETTHDELFPHIYGVMNLDAIVSVIPIQRGQDDLWQSPFLG